jgi:hypothetical protein
LVDKPENRAYWAAEVMVMADFTDLEPVDEPTGAERYRHLPEHVRLEDTITTQETEPARDPRGGQDTERDFMLRYGAGA